MGALTDGLFGHEAGDYVYEPKPEPSLLRPEAHSDRRSRDADTCTDSPPPRVLKADADRLAEALREARPHFARNGDDEQDGDRDLVEPINAALAAYEGGGS